MTGVLSMLVKQLEQEESKADERIKEFLIPVNRVHSAGFLRVYHNLHNYFFFLSK